VGRRSLERIGARIAHPSGMTDVLALLLGVVFGALRTRRDLVTENLLLRRLASGEPLASTVVRDLQGPPFPQLAGDALAQEAYTLFSSGQSAVAVMDNDVLEGIVTKSDLLEFWAHTRGE